MNKTDSCGSNLVWPAFFSSHLAARRILNIGKHLAACPAQTDFNHVKMGGRDSELLGEAGLFAVLEGSYVGLNVHGLMLATVNGHVNSHSERYKDI